ncbi:uncharacterized protein LOC143648921 [Tamandua tetradactyla]|uniref:uncharacterized protein LOC143648921 n=1 Tax=Tamandua tetradactyla TaxID=48850 RepID=UPI00405495A7
MELVSWHLHRAWLEPSPQCLRRAWPLSKHLEGVGLLLQQETSPLLHSIHTGDISPHSNHFPHLSHYPTEAAYGTGKDIDFEKGYNLVQIPCCLTQGTVNRTQFSGMAGPTCWKTWQTASRYFSEKL